MSNSKKPNPGPGVESALTLRIPRSLTALMQHLQLLVGREEYRLWCGGTVPRDKLAGLVKKFAARYPITATARQRTYARQRGRAAVQFITFPDGARVLWWLVSTAGSGGLGDPSSADAHVARDAHAAGSHIEVRDYVLLYATKKTPRAVPDKKSGRQRTIFKDMSTWTWKLRGPVLSELRAGIRQCCAELAYGMEDSDSRGGWGLRGILAAQRRRPLFSGVRTQVIDLHREARDAWNGQRNVWLLRHPHYAKKFGERAGMLTPIGEVIAAMPKMIRLPVFEAGKDIAALCAEHPSDLGAES